MTDGVTVEVKGLEELEERLSSFYNQFSKIAVRKALKSGAKVLWDAQRVRAPVMKAPKVSAKDGSVIRRPGELRDSLTIRIIMRTTSELQTAQIGPNGDGFYGKFLEFGEGQLKGRQMPWMRPAFDESAQKALDAFVDTLRVEVDKAARK